MQNAHLVYRGSFRYADHDALDRALCEAREYLDDDELAELDRRWMQFLSRRGMTVHVEAILPSTSDRYLAAAVLGALARSAVEGRVDVTIGNDILDAIAPEGDQA
jgi:hypothetical protein